MDSAVLMQKAGGMMFSAARLTSGGCSRWQRSITNSQRGAKAQPANRSNPLGTLPGMTLRSVPRLPGRGSAASRPRVYGCWGSANRVDGEPCLHDAPGVKDNNLLTGLRHDAQVVRDENDAYRPFALQRPQQVKDLGLNRHIKRGGRFIGDDHVGFGRQAERDHRALLLPARQLMRINIAIICAGSGKPTLASSSSVAAATLLRRRRGVRAQHIVDLLPDCEQGIQGGGRILKYHGDAVAADFMHLFIA